MYQLQSGFRGQYSTDTCLIYLHDFIRTEISKGNFVGLVALDVQKAFDSVDHNMLLQKIKLIGIEPDWFQSYLTSRKQLVSINGVLSTEQTIKSGVPQGKNQLKYLGICIDNTLSGENIVKSIVSKCSSRLSFLYRHKRILNVRTRKLLALSLLQCHFDYGASAWYPGLCKKCKQQLQVCQN